jgi:hypothetical protein
MFAYYVDEKVKEVDGLFKGAQFTRYISLLTGVESETVLSVRDHSLFVKPFQTLEMGVPEEVKRVVMTEPRLATPNGSYPDPVLNGRNTFNVYFNGVFWELFFVLLVLFGLSKLVVYFI